MAVSRRVLLPLPDRDFDVTEVAVPWHYLTEAGHRVVFATGSGGTAPAADQRLLDGVLFGQLGAADGPKALYRRLQDDPDYRDPVAWGSVRPGRIRRARLAGWPCPGDAAVPRVRGAPGRRGAFWQLGHPVGAICHGVLVLARTHDPATGRSVLADRRTTCLTKPMERGAYLATAWKLGRYYRTYPAYVEDEVVAALADRSQFTRGPRSLARDAPGSDDRGFTVLDGNYLSARWPGDAHTFARRFTELLD